MLNEVKHLYNKDSSLPLRLRSGLKAQNDTSLDKIPRHPERRLRIFRIFVVCTMHIASNGGIENKHI